MKFVGALVDTCENCGREIGRLETPHIWNNAVVCAPCRERLRVTPTDTARRFTCPCCHSEDTASSEMIYEDGKQTSTFLGFAIGGMDDIMVGGGQSQTISSQNASPPSLSSRVPLIGSIALSVIAVILFFSGLSDYQSGYHQDHENTTAAFAASALCAIFVIPCGIRAYQNNRWDKNLWPVIYQKWKSEWVYRRCGHKFIP